jgi:hypothetical protein
MAILEIPGPKCCTFVTTVRRAGFGLDRSPEARLALQPIAQCQENSMDTSVADVSCGSCRVLRGAAGCCLSSFRRGHDDGCCRSNGETLNPDAFKWAVCSGGPTPNCQGNFFSSERTRGFSSSFRPSLLFSSPQNTPLCDIIIIIATAAFDRRVVRSKNPAIRTLLVAISLSTNQHTLHQEQRVPFTGNIRGKSETAFVEIHFATCPWPYEDTPNHVACLHHISINKAILHLRKILSQQRSS